MRKVQLAAAVFVGWVIFSSPAAHAAIHPNDIGFFLGASTPTEKKSDTSLSIGAEYERRPHERWGFGAVSDFVFGDFKRTALAAPAVFIHPVGDLKIAVAPAAEWVEKEVVGPQGTSMKHEVHFVMRLGFSYVFHSGHFSLSPLLNVDFIGETKTTLVYGVVFGWGF